MAGLDYKLSNKNTIFVGYRYFATKGFEGSENLPTVGAITGKATIKAHAFNVGYRYSF
jgi:opacity protein-like surface antigen